MEFIGSQLLTSSIVFVNQGNLSVTIIKQNIFVQIAIIYDQTRLLTHVVIIRNFLIQFRLALATF